MYYQFYHNNVETVTNGSTAADKIKIKTLKVFYYLKWWNYYLISKKKFSDLV